VTPLRKNRDFVLLQLGQAFSTAGSSATAIAYPLLVLALRHSPARAGVVGFANIAPYALFRSLVAVLAVHRLTSAQIAVVAFVEGTAFVFFNVAEVGALRSVVPARQLPDAAAAEQARIAPIAFASPALNSVVLGYRTAVTPDPLVGRPFPASA
jgi:hypothetical protein